MSDRTSAPEELPFRVELRAGDETNQVERVLARAISIQLAHAIFKVAIEEHPGRRITLSKGTTLIADSAR